MTEADLPRHGRWRAERQLGSGGQGVVYAAVDAGKDQHWQDQFLSSLRQLVIGGNPEPHRRRDVREFFELLQERLKGTWTEHGALKVLHSVPGNPDVKARERLANEIKALRSIEHPNIVRILDADPNANWIVYELMSGGTLRDNHRRYKGDPIAAVDAISGLAEGVAKLHDKGLVHRDIKPANIFWGHDGRLVLGDFGLVFAQSGDRITNTDEKVGTTDWTPTWAIGHHRWDEVKPSFDVFALGKLLWALIAGDVFLRLHYFDRKEYDLTTRFPEDDRMVRINTLLSKCIVEHEADCLHDARALQQELEAIASVLVGPSRR